MIKIVFVLIGVILSIIVITSAWSTNSKGKSLKQGPKLQAAIYLFFGSVVVFIGDWETIFKQSFDNGDINKLDIAYFYLSGAILGTIISHIGYAIIIIKRFGAKNWLDFFFFGYDYMTKLEHEKEIKKLEHSTKENRNVLEQFLKLANDRAAMTAQNLSEIASYLERKEQGEKKLLIKNILKHICSAITPFITTNPGEFKINANYMRATKCDSSNKCLLDNAKYTWGDKSRYSYLLELKEYAENNHTIGNNLVLPVENIDHEGSKENVLPGAAESFYYGKPVIVNTAELNFAKNVPPQIQQEINDYFSGLGFTTCLSIVIPITRDGSPIGVVNIETNQAKITKYDDPERWANLLLPLTTTLGLLLKC